LFNPRFILLQNPTLYHQKGVTRKAKNRVGKIKNFIIMKKLNFLATAVFIGFSSLGAFAQQFTDPAVTWAASAGGARILSTQGNTPASPAIGFQSSVSAPGAPQEDGGGGNGIFRPLANNMAFSTGSLERMRINQAGFVGIGTATATNQLEVATTLLTNPAIYATGKSVGIYAEATAQESNLIKRSNIFSDLDGIAVFGNGKYTSNTTNGSMYGVVGSSTDLNPLNNIGVFGEAKNATGYNSGVIGYSNSTTGLYNSGVAGQVELNTTAVWNKAINGLAPVAPNHYAGYFDGNVEVQTGTLKVGNVTAPIGYKLYVEQGILTEKVKVAVATSAAWADYVFASDYNLKPLSEVESFIKENKHLPNIPSATDLEKEGLDLGIMQSLQMAKIEELTLYMIEMKKEIEILKTQNESLKTQIYKN
jgi:hypothetical protein